MDIPAWKQDFLDADLRYFQADAKFNLCETIEKLRGNHGLRYKVMRVLTKHNPSANMSVDAFLYGLETVKEYQIFTYKVTHTKGHSVAELDINDYYFKLVQMMPIPFAKRLFTPGSLVKRLEKETKKTYDKKARIDVIEY